MIIIKIILAILIILTVVNVYWGLFLGEDESISTAGILCFFIVGILITMPIISNTEDKAQDDSPTVCEEVVSESIEKETAETVVNETEDIITASGGKYCAVLFLLTNHSMNGIGRWHR